MRIFLVGKYPPIQGGVSSATYWTAQALADRGHDVHVFTNSTTVEHEFRCILLAEDQRQLHSRPEISPRCHQVEEIRFGDYIPWARPYFSQLFGQVLRECENSIPDVITGWYFEPYGVVAAQIAAAKGIPLVLRHAGSDIGRLANYPDLRSTYQWMLQNAEAVITSRRSEETRRALLTIGAKETSFRFASASPLSTRFLAPSDQIDPSTYGEQLHHWYKQLGIAHELAGFAARLVEKPIDQSRLTIGTYGKIGFTKGTFELLSTLRTLAQEGLPFNFLSLASGHLPTLTSFFTRIHDSEILARRSFILPALPPWRVPDFLAACDIVCILENRFPITFHMPKTPREVLSAGVCLVCSREIAQKQPFKVNLVDGKNCVIIDDPRHPDELRHRLGALLRNPEIVQSIGRHGKYLSEVVENEISEASIGTIESILESFG